MKKILLDTKWVGAVALVAYALFIAAFLTDLGVKFVNNIAPVVEREVDYFLPVTISGGEIISPKDTMISKTYGSGKNEGKVVLDTSVDEFETSAIKDKGLYISRKYIYAVSEEKTEIRSIEAFPDMVLDEETVHKAFEYGQEKAGSYIFFVTLIFFLIFAACAIGLYTVVMYWPLKALYKNEYKQVLRVNTFAYIIISMLAVVFGFNLSIVITFALLFGANCAVNEGLKKLPKE